MADRKAVSLSREMHLLIRTVDGVREAAERLSESMSHDEGLSLSIASNLTLLKERLRLIDRVVRGAVDPRVLWCPENNALPAVEGDSDDGGDVLLRAWSDKRAVHRLRNEWRAAKRRLRNR